jgi:sulfatase modifying factor 1
VGICLPGQNDDPLFVGDDEQRLGEYAWYDGDSNSQTHPVGEKKPNAFGLYDMHGNVWEWCWDWSSHDYYRQSPPNDPRGPGQGTFRVIRGGSWASSPRNARSAYRNGCTPVFYRDRYMGFRVARVPSSR